MSEQLSKFRIKQGRKIFDIYNGVNSLSFALVTGNTITLYALSLHANSTVIGLLTAFMYMCYFSIPLGKIMVRRFGIVNTFAYTWFLRNFSLLPMLFIPFFYFRGMRANAIAMLILAVALFNFFRGTGIIANNPVIGILAPGKDRSSYIVRVSLTNNSATFTSIIFLTVFLWFAAHSGFNIISIYNITSIIGIVLGFVSSFLLFKLPDPEFEKKKERLYNAQAEGKNKKEIKKIKWDTQNSGAGSFGVNVKEALKDKNFIFYLVSFFIIQFGISLARPFIIVYGKAVYSIPDNLVIIFSLASTAGSLLVGLLMRLLIDRMGAKPMYVIFTSLSACSLLPAITAPALGFPIAAFIFLIVFSIVVNMGFTAQLDAAQAYFFGIIPNKAIMDLSMLYYFVLGITGAAGSFFGGRLLDIFSQNGLSNLSAYRLFFLIIAVIIFTGIAVQSKLLNLGGRHIKETLAVIFSPRDMRALNLLYKLNANESLKTEEKILHELTEIASPEAADGLNRYMRSPRFEIRYSALSALRSLEKLSAANKDALLYELEHGEFTTAAAAASVLGHFKIRQAAPLLQKALESKDYLLAGEAMLALAQLNDTASQFKISQILACTDNPKLLLCGIRAIEIYNSTASIPLILDILRRENQPPHIEDEAFLVLASLMKIEEGFYYAYDRFKNESKSTTAVLIDALEEVFAKKKKQDMLLKELLLDFVKEGHNDSDFVDWVLHFTDSKLGIHSALLVSVIMDVHLTASEAFRFFLCCWAAAIFKTPALAEN